MAYAKLQDFRALSQGNGGKNWLSTTRNDMQYRLQHGVWHSTSLAEIDRGRIYGTTANWRADPLDIDLVGVMSKHRIQQFAVACSFLIAMFRTLLLNIERRSTLPKANFVSRGPRALAQHVGFGFFDE
ncbi:hypothetical protein [Bordetella sp. 15P40C-2]|uniref:hypothetical protein n=1 Tax=Bordetella sp. 15P40C-2 TaxID=2572246 RepID=UPI001328821B|nr:hypothetical protein [Bordetella sp. 15P40C-2]MVW72159.1 hypothetical protein [Bordetella sp. 15P40C-2]